MPQTEFHLSPDGPLVFLFTLINRSWQLTDAESLDPVVLVKFADVFFTGLSLNAGLNENLNKRHISLIFRHESG